MMPLGPGWVCGSLTFSLQMLEILVGCGADSAECHRDEMRTRLPSPDSGFLLNPAIHNKTFGAVRWNTRTSI